MYNLKKDMEYSRSLKHNLSYNLLTFVKKKKKAIIH